MAEFQNNFNIRKCKNLPLLILISLFLISPAFADKTVKTIKIDGGYVASASADTSYPKNFNFFSPDGFEKVYFSKATFFADNPNSQTTRFYVQVDGQYCTPNYYDIPINAVRYRMDFDCTDVVNKQKTYNGGFQANRNLNNVFGEWEITYLNNPSGVLNLFGTEYAVSQKGTVWLQLRDDNGQAVNNGSCHINIWKPNLPNSTHPVWIDNSPMLFLVGSDGLYYYDFIVPSEEGVYLMSADCSYLYNFEWYYDTIDNSSARTVISGSYQGDTVNLNSYEDYEYTECTSSLGAMKYCKAYYDFTLENTTIEEIDVFWTGSTDNNVLVEFFAYNWTAGNYIKLPNTLTTTGTGYNYPVGLDEMLSNVIPDLNNTISGTDTIRVLMNVSSLSAFYLFDNWLSLRASQVGDFLVDMRGSGEIHVSSGNVTGVSFVSEVENVSFVANALASFERLKYSGATEYLSGTEGQIVYQYISVVAGNPLPVNDAECNSTVWYPDDSVFLANQTLNYLSGSNGIYYYNFTVPSTEGVYKVQTLCYKAPKTDYSSSTFHVEDTVTNNQQQIYNFVQDMNITMVTNQEYMKSKIDDIWDYVNEMINNIYSMIIS